MLTTTPGANMLKTVGEVRPNILPPYAKGRRLDGNQNMRIFNTKKTPGIATKAAPPAVSSGNPPVLNKKSAFKAGFLEYVAKSGQLPSEFFNNVKVAFLDPASLAAAGGSGLSAVGSAASGTALMGLLAPLLTGTTSGAVRELFGTPSPESADTLRKMEQIGLYKRLTEEIKARSRRKIGG